MEERINCSLKHNKSNKKCKHLPTPIMPYFGGKQRVADLIISKFPDHDTFVEPFVGGGAIYWKNTIPEHFVINDLNDEVYQVYKTAKNSPEHIKKCTFKLYNKHQFDKIKEKKNRSSCDIISLHRNGFGASPKHFAFKDRPMNNNFDERHKEKLKKTTILNQDFRKVAKRYDKKGVVQYWDPPYVQAGNEYKTHGVTPEEVCKSAKQLKKAKVFISYDNNEVVKRACKGLKINKIKVPYSAGPGKNKIKTELLIEN